jgi:CDP-4-dehydro-6-deoxyglucose reductase, E3
MMSSAAPATKKHLLSLLPATLVKSESLSSEARLLTLRMEAPAPLEFLAGQCVQIEQELNGKTVSLVYSIASPPDGGNSLELCIKPGRQGSPADQLCALRVGSQVRISTPHGNFVLHPSETAAIFLAAGTGIAPIRSMIHWLAGKDHKHPFYLVHGARDADSLLFHSEFIRIAEQRQNFRYIPVLSRPNEHWSGAHGHVQHHLHDICREAAHAYLCGPPAMVQDARQALAEFGWPEHLLHHDRNGY